MKKNNLFSYIFAFILLALVVTYLIPVNYYIVTSGGVSNIDKRVIVEDAYKSKGSFNISYVEELKGNYLLYLLSYVVPSWERESYDDYKITDNESYDDIEFREKKMLDHSNGNASYWAYTLADKEFKLKESNTYIVFNDNKRNKNLKVKDELLSLDGYKTTNVSYYSNYLSNYKEGDKVVVKVIRGKKEKDINCKVFNQDDKNVLGVGLIVVNKYKSDKEIKYKFEDNESGPSGGLITTLDAYNKLVKEDITKGKKIAGTGTIEDDGTIGEIGGVKYKVIGAFKDKCDIFLVPEANYDECMKTVKSKKLDIKVIKVRKIYDAIRELKNL